MFIKYPKGLILICVLFIYAGQGSNAQALVEIDDRTNNFLWTDEIDVSTGGASGGPSTSGGNTPPVEMDTIRPNHFPDIRTAIDLAAVLCGVTIDVWDIDREQIAPQIGRPGQSISSAQVNLLRRAIEELYSQKSQPLPDFGPDVQTIQRISRSHVQDMRDALDALTDICFAPVPAVCGDGTIGTGEQCDDSNTSNGDGCSSTCQTEPSGVCIGVGDNNVPNPPVCVDRAAENNKTVPWSDCCSGSALVRCPKQGDPLRLSCVAVCGNGLLEAGETCDDSNTVSGDLCSSICRIEPVCGNGTVESPETCDDLNTANGDGCSSTCRTEVPPAVCGNGATETGEQCDDSNTSSGDGCSSTCQTETAVPACVSFTRNINGCGNPWTGNWLSMLPYVQTNFSASEYNAFNADYSAAWTLLSPSNQCERETGTAGSSGSLTWDLYHMGPCPADNNCAQTYRGTICRR